MCTVKKTPDDGRRNCPKHVEFYSKNKFEKLVHLVGFIVRRAAVRTADSVVVGEELRLYWMSWTASVRLLMPN